ncbi:MAG: isoprenyl transferase [Alphaproteobacteria bacterium]|nr:isoprenyl transferase [Alphaproteobacteria bacterium]
MEAKKLSSELLQHIAVIMDGNRRWAKKHGLPGTAGHKKGAETLQEIVKFANEQGIKYLTLYAFSTENWQRDADEVSALMDLLRQYLSKELKDLQENDVKIVFIGERQMLDSDITDKMSKIEQDTAHNDGLVLCIALSYGSRQEIVATAKKIASMVKRGDIKVNDIDTKMFSDMLYTKSIPNPDIVIRTGGEMRVSNYLLWQIAYSELFFSPTLWPDFNAKELEQIIQKFNQRERRYGKG